ncbi:MAG TPA: RNA 2',3'-cyclic phosphodiesterase [Actinomycetota bacterium]|nr:RNA 2',3'-cyclic phosphodiesterase [Actinomycetota bacterium]
MGDEKLRLFTAVRVPHAQLEWLDAAVGSLKDLPGARWTTLDNQHVTLNFLGWVEASLLPRVAAAVDATAGRHRSAGVSLGPLGAFPRERRARVVWAGLDDPSGLLADLARDLGERLRPLGYEPEQRAFTPHLTLARLETPRSVEGRLPVLPKPPGSFTVDRVTLFRSRLSPAGARYEVLHEAYLTRSLGERKP